jgi:hypothetical protein
MFTPYRRIVSRFRALFILNRDNGWGKWPVLISGRYFLYFVNSGRNRSTFFFVFKNLFARFKYKHFSTGQYKNTEALRTTQNSTDIRIFPDIFALFYGCSTRYATNRCLPYPHICVFTGRSQVQLIQFTQSCVDPWNYGYKNPLQYGGHRQH